MKKFYEFCNKTKDTATLKIVGDIGWDVDAKSFIKEVDALIENGIKHLSVYVNSYGGSVFDANEIVNQLKRFEKVDIEIGAIAASAACYIACSYGKVTCADNSLIMAHECSGGAYGTAADIESSLELMKKINAEIYKTISAKMNEDGKKVLDEYWGNKDLWMTAEEAVNYGLVSSVDKSKKYEKKDYADGVPMNIMNKLFNNNSNQNKTNMNEDEVRVSVSDLLGLSPKASLDELKEKLESVIKDKSAVDLSNYAEKTDLEKYADKASIETLKNALKDVQDLLDKRDKEPEPSKTVREFVEKALEKNEFNIASHISGGKIVTIPVRDAADDPMTTTTTGANKYPVIGTRFAGFAGLEPRDTPLFSKLFKGRSSEPMIMWADRKNLKGETAFVAEGQLKPALSYEIATGQCMHETVAGFSEFTRQLMQNYSAIAREIEMIIKNDLARKIEWAILNATPSTTSGGGVLQSATAYAGTNLLSGQVITPTYADAIAAIGLQIEITNVTARMDTVVVPLGFKTLMRVQKDKNGRSIASEVEMLLAGIDILETPHIPNTDVCGLDSDKWNVETFGDVEVRVTDSHDQNFTKNIFTILVERDIFMWHRKIDETSAVKGIWAAILTDIAKP